MLNQHRRSSECTADNLFIVKRGVVRTPHVNAGILEGITRNAVIELAKAGGIEVQRSRRSRRHRCLHGRRDVFDRHRSGGDLSGECG
jgi:branched-subunit amino acid aminotransferase/4-amino-4-deoxychorismate lyase